MPKKKNKTKSKRKPTVQEQLLALCELVNKLSDRVAQLQLEVGSLRPPTTIPCAPPSPFEGFKPWRPEPLPFEVTCKGPPPGAMYMGRRGSDSAAGHNGKDS